MQGAHIVPVSITPNYSTRNGLALCANHHLAYDNNLFLVERDYRIAINDRGVRALAASGLAGGTDQVLGGLQAGARYVAANSYLIKADIEKSGASHDH